MKLQIIQFSQREIELPLPAFFKDNSTSITDIVAILDEDTMVMVWDYPGRRTVIENCEVKSCNDRIVKIYEKYQLATEDEFFAAFNRAYAQLSLTPKLQP